MLKVIVYFPCSDLPHQFLLSSSKHILHSRLHFGHIGGTFGALSRKLFIRNVLVDVYLSLKTYCKTPQNISCCT